MSMNSKYGHALVLFYNRKHHPVIVRRLLKSGINKVDTVIVNLGEIKDLEAITSEAKRSGSQDVHYLDGRDKFSNDYLSWLIRANSVYRNKYYLSAAIARPCLVDLTVAHARQIGADVIAHGFRGNDMIRMNIGYQNSDVNFIPALSEYKIEEDEIKAISKEFSIPDEFGSCNPYSVSDNIWGRSVECGPLENIGAPPQKEILGKCKKTSSSEEIISIGFERGIPTSLNGHKYALHEIIETLNDTCGSHGIGLHDLVEDGTVGFKTRAIYEHPAATCIVQAHRELEHLVLNKHEAELKEFIDNCFAKNIYAGLWYDPVMEHMKCVVENINRAVSGEISLRLMDGSFTIEGRYSSKSLYKPDISIYNYGHLFSEGDAQGFANTFNLHTYWTIKQRNEKK